MDDVVNISDDEIDIEDNVSYSSESDSFDFEDDMENSPTENWQQTNIGEDINVSLPQFYGMPGINPLYESSKSMMEIFHLFFTDELIDALVTFTNIRAELFTNDNDTHMKENSRVRSWRPVTSSEMRKFIKIVFFLLDLSKKQDSILTQFYIMNGKVR